MSLKTNASLVVLTAILAVFLPTFFEAPPAVITDGFVAPGFEDVLKTFRENFESGRDSLYGGSAFSAYYNGKKVVDLWGGYADADIGQQWRQDTMSIFYSTTKGIAAICFALLVDRGQLNYDKAVAHYWPEFAQKGKENITVRELLEHKSGLPVTAPPGLSYELMSDVPKAGELMAASEPLWKPDGKTHGYHTITYGPLTNELLRRVDPKHRTLGKFFAEEIAEPFGLEFYIGLPLEKYYRTARIPGQGNLLLSTLRGLTSATNRQVLLHMLTTDVFMRSVEDGGMGSTEGLNDPYKLLVEIPSASGIGMAESVAKLYGILAMGGTDPQTNKTLFSRQTAHDLMKDRQPTLDRTLGIPMAYNLGFALLQMEEGVMYGHAGAGGQMGFADPVNKLGFAFVSSSQSPFVFPHHAPRTKALLASLYTCVKNQPTT
ncbi:beta-lactamase domain-containing protein 2-like [Diadema setosum]|uniref:beta-lactamase domain-containing protein 2-like n=1 Tax=Diadema setosum TaxID=31175 RepID=UPI003B3B073B